MLKPTQRIGIIIASAFLVSIQPTWAQTTIDPRAQDAVDLFVSYCALTGGSREKALTSLGEGNEIVNKLADERVQALQGGRTGGVAWALMSPRKAELLLEYEARGICGVRIAEADELSVQRALELAVRNFAERQKGRLINGRDETRMKDGVQLTFKDWIIEEGGKKKHFGLTTAARRLGQIQHFMTFGYLQ